jgi:hypothetical protein
LELSWKCLLDSRMVIGLGFESVTGLVLKKEYLTVNWLASVLELWWGYGLALRYRLEWRLANLLKCLSWSESECLLV